MPNDLTERIRSLLRIEDIIGRTVSLRKTQRGWSGLCPFHDDKSPSFHVYGDSQSYYCFACHESGDIFTFVMKTQNLTFPEAVSLLAEEAGIDAGQYRKQGGSRDRSIYDVLKMAQEFFTENFRRLTAGRVYLEGRGISPEIAASFGIGYAPESWSDLLDVLSRRGIDRKMMIDSGLIIEGKNGMHDRFRGRLMFPVKDISGRIIAFGGRLVAPDGTAKYINSPESDIYRKRRNLYMLNTAGNYIREKGYSILCEGYMDVIRLHMAGFRESVASLGTSLTAEQAGLLKRFADRCYICYDGDSAGQKASIRGMYILAENGLDVRVIRLPEGQDPDDFLRANPPESFEKAIASALPLIPYHIEMLRPLLEDGLRRKGALRDLWDGVRKAGADESLRYLASLCGIFSLPPDEMRRRILDGRKNPAREIPAPVPEPETVSNGLECGFCAMLMRNSECRMSPYAGKIAGLLTDEDAKSVAGSIISDGPEGLLDMWRAMGETGKTGIISRGEIFLSQFAGLDEAGKWERICSDIQRQGIMRRIREIEGKMSANTADFDEMRELSGLHEKLRESKTA